MKFILQTVGRILTTLLNGYVLSTLWAWFVVSTFSVPALSIPAALGVGLVIRLTTFQIPATKTADWEEAELFIIKLLIPVIALVVGWIIKLWM